MAKPLDDRIAAAMGNGARATTVAELSSEVDAAIAEAQAEHDRLDALSRSATANETEADQAADDVTKLARKIVRLNAKKAQLDERYEELMNSERRKRGEEEYAQAKANRDQLAADLVEQWGPLTDQICGLLERITASDAECERANKNRYGGEWLGSAEAEARQCPANFYRVSGPVHRLVNVRIPSLLGTGNEELAWPKPIQAVDYGEAARQQRIAAQKARAAVAAGVKRYFVSPPSERFDHNGRAEQPVIDTQAGPRRVAGSAIMAKLNPEQAEAARQKGCTLELAKDGETLGLPTAAVSF